MLSRITETIYIGDWQDAYQNRSASGVAILTCAFDAPFKGQFSYPIVDGPADNNEKTFWEAVDKLIELQKDKTPTLVHCVSGLSRSVSVVVAYLMKTEKLSYDEALMKVTVTRPVAIKPFFYTMLRNM